MKKNLGQTKKVNIKFDVNRDRPEIRDDMDSRKKLEQLQKGDDMTHNRKRDKHKPSKER